MDVIGSIISLLWIIFGLLLIFIIPGYVILLALYPKKSEIDTSTRVALGFAVSIAVVMISNLTLDLVFGIDTTSESILNLTLFITVLFLIIWQIRLRFLIPSQEKSNFT